jgi:hypothetical protein
MDEVKRKVYLDLFASPLSLLPLAGGLTALMASWAAGGSPTMTMLGIGGVLGGIGVTLSRLIWGIEDLTAQAYEYQLDKQRRDQEAALDHLFTRLQKDHDPRSESCLQELRLLYGSLQAAAEKGNITTSAFEILDTVGKVFDQCVKQLEHSLSLWETAQRLRGPARETLLSERDNLMREIGETVVDVGKKVEAYIMSETQRNRSELKQVRRELNESIEAARRAEKRTAELERTAWDDIHRYEQS